MIRVHRRPLRSIAAVLALGLIGAACGSSGGASAKGKVKESTTTTTIAKGPDTTAAVLRSKLNGLLEEHVYLASAATGAALGGRAAEFTAAVAGVYGPQAGTSFAPLWKKHIGFLVDYTNAVAGKQQAKADEAMGNLLQYTEDFGAFINSASPKLTKDAVAQLVKTHVFTLKDVIDAQAAKNFTKAFTNERIAADHMAMIANGLSATVVAQFPKQF